MSTTDPEQVRADIERTRRELSRDVDTLEEHVRPSAVARRQTERARAGVSRLRERVMGTSGSSSRHTTDAVHHATDSVRDAAGSVGDAVSGAPRVVREQTEGNPLAVGLVAFGLGLIAASLVPASRQEAEAAGRVKEAAAPLVDDLKEAGASMAQELKGTAQEHAEGLKDSVSGAGHDMAEHGRQAAQDVAQEVKGGSSGQA
ncbi:DUF3618 domain-containing protein [Isoptericola sp. NPDC057191]|uniref:DUF3618 domain-containing protein n=1 Tax=Isoptericola sp. NPDC057191 TaxID=3346041 RepID=UPI00362A1D34